MTPIIQNWNHICLELKEWQGFGKYASRKGKDQIAEVYQNAAYMVKMIYWKKIRDENMSPGEWEDDRVFAAIKKQLEGLK